MRRALFLVLVTLVLASRPLLAVEVAESVDVEPVWSAHPVGFCLLTHGEVQFVGYYDAKRVMSIAQRRLGEKVWTIHKLPRVTGWDSHNYVTIAIDSAGFLHVSGDMHGVPLVYFRSARPLDAASLEPVHRMTGEREQRVTYPVFLRDKKGHLIFRYRDGGSGNGDDLFNIYDVQTRQWRRLVEQPIISGGGQMNAYCTVPALGPDGYFHMVWVWRDTPDAATNHHPSYARSKDLVHWETSAGTPLDLPITLATSDIVDPVPPRGGIINGNVHFGLDSTHRPIVTYHKYDALGRTQVYAARREGERWVVRQLSDWDYRWEFGGGGAIGFEVRLGSVRIVAPGRLAMNYRYPGGRGVWVLDEATLKVLPGEKPPAAPGIPASLRKMGSPFPGMIKKFAADSSTDTGQRPTGAFGRYLLVWETLPPARDRPRPKPWPEPVMLRVVRIAE